MTKKTSCVAVFLAMVIVTAITATAQVPYNEQSPQWKDPWMDAEAHINALYGEDYMAINYPALYQYSAMQRSFMRRGDGSVIYPDFYGGAYINSDGKLIALIVEGKLDGALAYDVFRERIESGAYRFVEFSHAQLREVMDAIIPIMNERIDNNCLYAKNVSSWGARATINRVIVYINEYNDEMIAGFQRYVYDSPMLVFMQRGFFRFGDTRPLWVTIMSIIMIGFIVVALVVSICKIVRRLCRLHDNRHRAYGA